MILQSMIAPRKGLPRKLTSFSSRPPGTTWRGSALTKWEMPQNVLCREARALQHPPHRRRPRKVRVGSLQKGNAMTRTVGSGMRRTLHLQNAGGERVEESLDHLARAAVKALAVPFHQDPGVKCAISGRQGNADGEKNVHFNILTIINLPVPRQKIGTRNPTRKTTKRRERNEAILKVRTHQMGRRRVGEMLRVALPYVFSRHWS